MPHDALLISPMRVHVKPGSRAQSAYLARATAGGAEQALAEAIAPGFKPRRADDLHFWGGWTMTTLTFTNFYLGGNAWKQSDVDSIDRALAAAMSDTQLNNVIAQYFADPVRTTFHPSRVLPDDLGDRVYKDDIEGLVARLFQDGGLSGYDYRNTIFNFMLPSGVVLVDGFRPGGTPVGTETAAERDFREQAVIKIDDEDTDSRHGLGGYHGSVHVAGPGAGATTTLYYAVGVYSEIKNGTENGIAVFDLPWKNVVATFFHELNEARSDADVEDVIRAGGTRDSLKLLGWMSLKQGEIGDIPITEADRQGMDLHAVFVEIPLANGDGTVPVQLMWSNAVHGPEGPIAKPHRHHQPSP